MELINESCLQIGRVPQFAQCIRLTQKFSSWSSFGQRGWKIFLDEALYAATQDYATLTGAVQSIRLVGAFFLLRFCLCQQARDVVYVKSELLASVEQGLR